MSKENSSLRNSPPNSSASRTPATSSLFSVTHPSVNSRNKDDLYRRIRSGNDVLCSLPTRLDPNLQFSDDEDEEATEEMKKEKPVVNKTPQFRSQQFQPPVKTVGEFCARNVSRTPSFDYKRLHNTSTKSSTLDSSMKRYFPHSATKTKYRSEPEKTKTNLMPDFKVPNSEPRPLKKASSLPRETILVNGKSYQVLSLLGSGGSCKVYAVFDTEKKSLVAIKCVDMKNADIVIRKGFEKEIEYLKQLRNSNRVIRMFDYQHTGDELFIVLERGEIDLAKYLSNEVNLKSFTPLKVKFYWAQMLEAVSDIHKLGIVHSDLKPANFLLVAGNLKLIDFGIATSVPDDKTSALRDTYIGTLNYMSPEAVTQSSGADDNQICFKVGVKSDVWSLGCILYNLVYGETPFQNIRSVVHKINAITNPSYEIVFKPIADKLLLDVLQLCLRRNPKERASVDELLQHPYLTEDSPKEDVKSEHLQNVMQQMQGLTPRRMNYITKVLQDLTHNQK